MEKLDRGVFSVDRKGSKSWVARLFSDARPIEHADRDDEVLKFLEKKGFPAERCATAFTVSHPGSWSVLVTEFIDGKSPEATPETFKNFGSLLGVLNPLQVESGPVSREAGALHHSSRIGGWPKSELETASSWLDELEKNPEIKNHRDFQRLREELKEADDCHNQPLALIHPDPVLKNSLQTSKYDYVLVDWTGAGRARLASLAILLWIAGLGRAGWSRERVDAAVEGYRLLYNSRKTSWIG